ncbi:hypothetical protein HYDPIDRAFT_188517 [Hydnomerulius pinastri MD-312]|uniref:Cerato-platanin n=1 Tax=Hydnomerulius pinastri MD-312 TaxID=994086 RepID=A0A0C9WEH8_9AGAM|nr:hypothetical protein HYDPIDRAFT_188517 [Hydnomerulius pinastri MD-312]
MKLAAAAFVAVLAAPALAAVVTYDPIYDSGSTSLDEVACSNGKNGVETMFGYKKFKDIPNFPFIGGVPTIKGWNSPVCGSCWQLAYTDPKNSAHTTFINITAIDTGNASDDGFNISLEAMNYLTGGKAKQLGRAQITATRVEPDYCNLGDTL